MPHIILFQPEIPPNTGNIIRLAANCGFGLHLIEPLGFSLDEKAVRRAGMDYEELASVHKHASLADCLTALQQPRMLIVSTKGKTLLHDFRFKQNDALLFGNEGSGLPQQIWDAYTDCPSLRIPMRPGNRSINLANAVAIAAWQVWQQLDFS